MRKKLEILMPDVRVTIRQDVQEDPRDNPPYTWYKTGNYHVAVGTVDPSAAEMSATATYSSNGFPTLQPGEATTPPANYDWAFRWSGLPANTSVVVLVTGAANGDVGSDQADTKTA